MSGFVEIKVKEAVTSTFSRGCTISRALIPQNYSTLNSAGLMLEADNYTLFPNQLVPQRLFVVTSPNATLTPTHTHPFPWPVAEIVPPSSALGTCRPFRGTKVRLQHKTIMHLWERYRQYMPTWVATPQQSRQSLLKITPISNFGSVESHRSFFQVGLIFVAG